MQLPPPAPLLFPLALLGAGPANFQYLNLFMTPVPLQCRLSVYESIHRGPGRLSQGCQRSKGGCSRLSGLQKSLTVRLRQRLPPFWASPLPSVNCVGVGGLDISPESTNTVACWVHSCMLTCSGPAVLNIGVTTPLGVAVFNNFMVGAHRNMKKNRMKCHSFRKRTTAVPPEGSVVPTKEEKETMRKSRLPLPGSYRASDTSTFGALALCKALPRARAGEILPSLANRPEPRWESRQGAVRRSTDSGCLSALAPGRSEFLFCFLSLEIQNRFFFLHL